MNLNDFQEGNEAVMAWLQECMRGAERVNIARLRAGEDPDEFPRFQYSVAASDRTIDMDFKMDEHTVSLIRITAVERKGKTRLEIKRFAGPRGEAYDEADEWREKLFREA